MIERKQVLSTEIDFTKKYQTAFVTLDGYVYDPDNNQYSYDNDLDQTVPAIHQGVKNPDAEVRQKGSSGRKYYLPRQLKSVRLKPIQFWIEGTATLSEIESAYPQISSRIKGLGNRSAQDLLSLLVYLHVRFRRPIEVLPKGLDLVEICERRARAHQYSGKWKKVSKLLQYSEHPALFEEVLKEQSSYREINGNLIPRGKVIYESLKVELVCNPVKNPKRKRGYADNHSRRADHEIHELAESRMEVSWTRDSSKTRNPLVSFLYGSSNPARVVDNESETEKTYRRKINRQIKELKRKERQRQRELSSEVISYRL